MRNIFIIIILSTLSVKSQVINYQNFNNEVFNKILFNKVNDYRKSEGLDVVQHSKKAEIMVSKKNTEKMVSDDILYHVHFDFADKNLQDEMDKEYEETMKKLNLKKTGKMFLVTEEIIAMTWNTSTTYEELAKTVLQLWINSKPHNEALHTMFGDKTTPGVGSCYSKVGKNGKIFYTFNFFSRKN